MEFKGTKGEWATTINKYTPTIYTGTTLMGTIADVYGLPKQKQHNAKLIAAAPELLKALQVFVDFPKEDLEGWIDEGTPVTMTVQSEDLYKALKAINKALN
jgi:hypothetical protein